MSFNSETIPYAETDFFTKIITDYLSQNENLNSFYQFNNTEADISEAIKSRLEFKVDRKMLHTHFSKHYSSSSNKKQLSNIDLLLNDNCFTITTAHQPNIFTGPLYFIYKVLHTIKLSTHLNKIHSDYSFVPVFFMGSEDADLEELGTINIQCKKLKWETNQTGAVGRMLVDENFIQLINEIENQIAVNEFGAELITIFRSCYSINKPIELATFELINILFGKYGLLVLLPDDRDLKSLFLNTIQKELTEIFSNTLVEKTNVQLSKFYKVQATGREINLFYLIDNSRERIELHNGFYIVEKLNLKFTHSEILKEAENFPERFSPNVILRPVFQETILPNIAFIGGGGEIAYWLQLKSVFENANAFYPMLILRNSFLLFKVEQKNKLNKMGLEINNLFANTENLFSDFVQKQSSNNLNLSNQKIEIQKTYATLIQQIQEIDSTLINHIKAIETKALNNINQLEKKVLKAEKKKFAAEQYQLNKISSELFPNNSLQERKENFSYYYSKYGVQFLDTLLNSSLNLEQEFLLLELGS